MSNLSDYVPPIKIFDVDPPRPVIPGVLKDMSEVDEYRRNRLRIFLCDPFHFGIDYWLNVFQQDAFVRSAVRDRTPQNLAWGLLNKLAADKYPIAEFVRLVAEHAPLSLLDAQIKWFLEPYMGVPNSAGTPEHWKTVADIPKKLWPELVKIFIESMKNDEDDDGVLDWFLFLHVPEPSRAQCRRMSNEQVGTYILTALSKSGMPIGDFVRTVEKYGKSVFSLNKTLWETLHPYTF